MCMHLHYLYPPSANVGKALGNNFLRCSPINSGSKCRLHTLARVFILSIAILKFSHHFNRSDLLAGKLCNTIFGQPSRLRQFRTMHDLMKRLLPIFYSDVGYKKHYNYTPIFTKDLILQLLQ